MTQRWTLRQWPWHQDAHSCNDHCDHDAKKALLQWRWRQDVVTIKPGLLTISSDETATLSSFWSWGRFLANGVYCLCVLVTRHCTASILHITLKMERGEISLSSWTSYLPGLINCLAQTLPNTTLLMGKIRQFSQIDVTFKHKWYFDALLDLVSPSWTIVFLWLEAP